MKTWLLTNSEEDMFVQCSISVDFKGWLILLPLNSALVVISVSLGWALFASIPQLSITHGIKCKDLYTFKFGCYIIWVDLASILYVDDHHKCHSLKFLLL